MLALTDNESCKNDNKMLALCDDFATKSVEDNFEISTSAMRTKLTGSFSTNN